MMTKMTNDLKPAARPHWTACLGEIRGQLANLPRVLVASDFDGTLSPIVDRPADAALDPSAPVLLERLAAGFPRLQLAFLSGRGLVDLEPRLGRFTRNAILAGNHGLEIRGQGMDWIHPGVSSGRIALAGISEQLAELMRPLPGVEIEDKGASVTLHYRRLADENLQAFHNLLESVRIPDGIRLHEGKKVYEFRPRVDWNKGFAIRRIADEMGIEDRAILFLGDDVTDEDAFDELGPEAITVHVGLPTDVSGARFSAADPADVVRFLAAVF